MDSVFDHLLKTLLQRRDRAMVAFEFVSGFRAGALCTLRFRHLDLEKRTVKQYAADMRVKNGKSCRAKWFPRAAEFQKLFLRRGEALQG